MPYASFLAVRKMIEKRTQRLSLSKGDFAVVPMMVMTAIFVGLCAFLIWVSH